jgi:hypothetical protein
LQTIACSRQTPPALRTPARHCHKSARMRFVSSGRGTSGDASTGCTASSAKRIPPRDSCAYASTLTHAHLSHLVSQTGVVQRPSSHCNLQLQGDFSCSCPASRVNLLLNFVSHGRVFLRMLSASVDFCSHQAPAQRTHTVTKCQLIQPCWHLPETSSRRCAV